MEESKLSERDYITLMLKENNIEVSIKYPKQTALKTRIEILNKLNDFLRKA